MKYLSKLDQYMETAPLKAKLALASVGIVAAGLMASYTAPSMSEQMQPDRPAPIVQQESAGYFSELRSQVQKASLEDNREAQAVSAQATSLVSTEADRQAEIERIRPMQKIAVEDTIIIANMNERTSDVLRDLNEIATRFHESKAWTGTSFTPAQKAKNIATAFLLANLRADHPELKDRDNFLVKLRADTPDNVVLNNVIADLNHKREVLRDATIELATLAAAVKDDNAEKVEFHRERMVSILQEAEYALHVNTDWSLEKGQELTR
jgi:hypothetical protein